MILRNLAIRHARSSCSVSCTTKLLRRPASTQATPPAAEPYNEQKEMDAQRLRREVKARRLAAKEQREQEIAELSRQATIHQYKTNKNDKRTKGNLGSVMTPTYQPQRLVTDPPTSADVTLELLLASQTHMGHATSLWNPANQRYIEGIRQGIHIISLEVTAAHLRRAAKVVEGVCYHGGLVLFLGTRPGFDRAVSTASHNAKGCHLFQRWIPGTITNAEEILMASKMMAVDEHDNPIVSAVYDKKIGDFKKLKPDLVIVLNPTENYLALHECSLYNIPTIGIIDTDADPTWVTYPIPANDDSLRSVNLITGVLGMAGKSGQAKRLQAAKTGIVTWTTPDTLKEWAKEDETWMKKYKADLADKTRGQMELAAKRAKDEEQQQFGSKSFVSERASA